MTEESDYEVLGLQPGASLEQIKEARRDLVKVWHPDRFTSDPALRKKAERKLQDINGAYERLQSLLSTKQRVASPRRSTSPERARSSEPPPPSPSQPPPQKPTPPPFHSNPDRFVRHLSVATAFLLALLGLLIWYGSNKTENPSASRPASPAPPASRPTSPAPSASRPASPAAASPDSKDAIDSLAAKARADIKRYRATLGPVLEFYERELKRQLELDAARKGLYEKGSLSESELREGRRALIAAQKDVDEQRRSIEEADRLLRESDEASKGSVRGQPQR